MKTLDFDKIDGIHISDIYYVQLQKVEGIIQNKKVYIKVHLSEGLNIPHFHIRKFNSNSDSSDCCIKIKENKYFIHGCHNLTLNSKELKILNLFLNKKHEKANCTNWQAIIKLWNKLNNDNIDINLPIPDYQNISIN